MKTLVSIISTITIACSLSFAEVRVWTDSHGKTYQAEFVRELFDKVTVRDAQGKEYRFAVEDLSENDQKYIRVMVPPQIQVDCKVTSEVLPVPWDLWHADNALLMGYIGEMTVQKISKRPFTGGLKAELYLIAREVDGRNYYLLSKTESSFLLSEQNNYKYTLKSAQTQTRVYTEFNRQRRGEEYLGYLTVVLDARGNIIDTQTDIGEWIKTPELISNLRDLSIRGEASLRSRCFDKTGLKVETTRPKFYEPDNR